MDVLNNTVGRFDFCVPTVVVSGSVAHALSDVLLRCDGDRSAKVDWPEQLLSGGATQASAPRRRHRIPDSPSFS
jgi:hypothetical protein